jgi:type IV pilus assembly protein PilY1
LSTDAYAGDLFGNVWHFSLSGGSANGSGSTIYVAKDANGNTQPITAGMTAAYNSKDGSRWIFFGTGKYLNAVTDVQKTPYQQQTWYGLRVNSAITSTVTVTSGMSRTDLMQRTIVAQQQTANGSISRATSVVTANENMQSKAGWYLDLAYPAGVTNGERIITPSQIIGGYLFVSSLIPSATDLCNPYPSGAIMAVDPFTGANPGVPIQDTNGDGVIDAADGVGGIFFNSKLLDVALGGMLTAQTTAGGITISGVDLKGNPTTGNTTPNSTAFSRLSWREILNQ